MPAVGRDATPRNSASSPVSNSQLSTSAAHINNNESNDNNMQDSDLDHDDNNNNFDNCYAHCDGKKSNTSSSMQRGCASQSSLSSQPSFASASAAADGSSSSSSSQPRQGLGVEPRSMAAIGQMGSHPWFILNRSLRPWTDDDDDDASRYAIPKMRRCRGYQVKNSVCGVKQLSERLQLIRKIEDKISYLNVFFFFRDIFQGDRRVKTSNNKEELGKTYLYTNPADAVPWGRQQSSIPIQLPVKYSEDGKVLRRQSYTLLELAEKGILWLHDNNYKLMQNPEFRKALLDAISANKENPKDCHRWEGGKDCYKPKNPALNLFTGEKPKEGKIDSCGVIFFGGLFVIAKKIEANDVGGNAIRMVPRYRMCEGKDGKVVKAAVVMPHPDNLKEIEDVVGKLHMLVKDSIKGYGPLMKQDVDKYAEKVLGEDGTVQVDVEKALPIAFPALLRSFPGSGVLEKEQIQYFPSGQFITDFMQAVMNKEIEKNFELEFERSTGVKSVNPYKHMYETAYNYANDVSKSLGLLPMYGVSDRPDDNWANVDLYGRGKQGTPIQVGHIDGCLEMPVDHVPWVSMLMPISDTACLRYWQYSHMLTEAIRFLTYEDNDGKKVLHSQDNEEIIRTLANNKCAENAINLLNGVAFATLKLLRGSSMIFLPSWVHAGACVPPGSGYINYRLHAYLVRPGEVYQSDRSSRSHRVFEAWLQGFSGTGYDLDGLMAESCICGRCKMF